jgi:hypothetical protein
MELSDLDESKNLHGLQEKPFIFGVIDKKFCQFLVSFVLSVPIGLELVQKAFNDVSEVRVVHELHESIFNDLILVYELLLA